MKFGHVTLISLIAAGSSVAAHKYLNPTPASKQISVIRGPANGWNDLASSNRQPSIFYNPDFVAVKGRPDASPPGTLSLKCVDQIFLEVSVGGFKAAQAFPQPQLIVQIGGIKLGRTPDATQSVYSKLDPTFARLSFKDSVDPKFIAAIRSGQPFHVEFNGEKITIPPPPSDVSASFTKGCEDALPEGWTGGQLNELSPAGIGAVIDAIR